MKKDKRRKEKKLVIFLRKTEYNNSWVKVLQLEPSLILDAEGMVHCLQGAGRVLRDTHTHWFRCEESQHCAKMCCNSQPFSSLHRITNNTLGKQSILWGIVRCCPNDWQEVRGSFITDSNNNCWWIHNILHGILQKTELTEVFLTFYFLESTCTTMGIHSEL